MCPVQTAAKMAGGLGIEPRLAGSESAVLPVDDPPIRFRLGVLRAPASFAAANLLALDLAGIACDEACGAQRPAQRLVVLHECASDAVTDGAGLAGDASAAHLHRNI